MDLIPIMNSDDEQNDQDKCTSPISIPPEEIARYSPERDPHSEKDIARYVEIEAHDENVLNVEKIKQEFVLGREYEVWDVTTDKDRWWVITNLTNLYSQKHFPSLDYTLSFHIGLMMRISDRSNSLDTDEPDPFNEIYRRQDQIKEQFDQAIESEDYQAIGLQLRECLISLIYSMRRRVNLNLNKETPQDANFVEWSNLLMDELCVGKSNKQLRQYLKHTAKESWQLVQWLAHDRDANQTATLIAIHSCDTIIGHFISILERTKLDSIEQCPLCNSRNIRSHFDGTIGDDGDYFNSCGSCDWDNHPYS
jgi:hypothetical protein